MQSPPAAHCGQSLFTSEQSEEQMPHETLRRKQAGSALASWGGAAALSVRSCPRLPQAPAHLGQSAAWVALAGHTGLGIDIAACGHVVAMPGFFLHSPLRAQPPQASSLS